AMPWPGASLKIAILLLAATVGPPGLKAEGNVDFTSSLYEIHVFKIEPLTTFFPDYAFGRCLKPIGDVDEDDIYRHSVVCYSRYSLEREALHELSAELRRLFALGYRWSHGYTQCRLQAMLYSIKQDMTFEPDACSHLVDNDLEGALKAMESQVQLDPQEVAIIKYTPSADNPHAAYADEVFYPPVNKAQEELREKILAPNAINLDMPDPYADYAVEKRSWIPQMHRRSLPRYLDDSTNLINSGSTSPVDALEFLQRYETGKAPIRKKIFNDRPTSSDEDDNFGIADLAYPDRDHKYKLIKFLNNMYPTPNKEVEFLNLDKYAALLDYINGEEEDAQIELLKQQWMDRLKHKQNSLVDEWLPKDLITPDDFRTDWGSRDTLQYLNLFPESRVYSDEDDDGQEEETTEYGSGTPNEEIFRERKTHHIYELPSEKEIFRELAERNNGGIEMGSRPGVYTEGGVVWSPSVEKSFIGITPEQENQLILKDNLDKLLEKYDLGFKRPERLDVKKPGPPFDAQITESVQRAEKLMHKSEDENTPPPSMMKKKARGVHPNSRSEQEPARHENDMDYVYVEFKNDFKDWTHGNSVIKNISNLLHIEPMAFTDGETYPKSIMFKVKPNNRGLTASEVAKKIDGIKLKLKELTGAEVYSVGIGDSTRRQTVISTPMNNEHQFYIVLFMVCGVLAAMIIATILLIFIRRHIKSKEKLQGLSRPDTEASKDYQDLCRSRMAAKGQPPAAGETVHGRITSLSRESEQSPSSRSSTSSWSEEPALHNMDISTGHMVLSYMEDHLKNKDRLEQEWVALCAYVAEPCETTMALKKENVDKNRYPEIVPYDHARVVLNELSNASGSDYINASSITDHDPRNPAYIATQGPLPHTAPDFWQLIWEQGAVVIVMLTRLTEGGAAMCHRYWPEEGSELYHIYEVHLVSEHIWCDDYLVRSFYLKNVRTGETRTVTQFHFLSWPESGVPASTKALLEFRRKVNKSYRGRSCPIVVHCSDGAGRTGTYCLIDMVLSRMAKGAKEIDIAATLEHLRDQRPRMVATKQQFEFVLTAVAEEVHAILKALPPQPAPVPNPEK
ncbi:hypothetical protein NQ315_005447, partial [Exocentrus adspersus]